MALQLLEADSKVGRFDSLEIWGLNNLMANQNMREIYGNLDLI